MQVQKSLRMGIIVVSCYMALVALALLYFVNRSSDTPLASLFIMALTFPWSYLTTIILLLLGVVDETSLRIKVAILLLCSLINAGVLYFLIVRKNHISTVESAKGNDQVNTKKP